MSPPPDTFSIVIFLPETIERRFRRWAEETPGASWPAWGGHITLLPTAQARAPLAQIQERVEAVCARYHPFEVRLAQPRAVPDWTRPRYHAVFLSFTDQDDMGMRVLRRLQEELDQATAELRSDLYPELKRTDFIPHITLALGLAQPEADEMVEQLREIGLAAQFVVDTLWMVVFQQDGESEEVQRRRIPIPLAAPAK
ncbi:2'-5' RNA ligase family protein [Litorilinea aerophila]|uniref:2'-5' RNA ligase family protein n=1 Tax=Litorilinea aerophila TaxID=1204385 RepID=A0A540VBC9_9CHLR|nr:2'-5' RNA ligase family protein [Litorilinea aerophila]MCC9078103.1 2'-5' RNA ligase family protein [Litorilinea aerophila]OUC06959.1 hypothetical protein RY27_17805 [Litorilinea aerophila]GIV77961.1 MAG: hypothetical protein KatS3mg050_2355 [Litorilinea sp.]